MDISRIDLNLLIVFDALYAERSVTRAGKRLGLSQPAVSGALARLRRQFDEPLFVRGPGGMQPTAFASELAAPLREILARMENLLIEKVPFDPATAVGSIKVAVSDHGAWLFLPELVQSIMCHAPSLHLEIHEIGDVHGSSTLERLEADELDIAVGYFDKLPQRICARPLESARQVVVTRQNHPAISTAALDLEAYLDLDHLTFSFRNDGHTSVDQYLAKRGKHRRISVTLPYAQPVARIIASTDLCVTVPSTIAAVYQREEPLLAIHSLPFELPPDDAYVIWHRRKHRDGLNRWIRERLASAPERC